ncbi:MAG: 4Fe-4S binding protein [Spirochaetales bacterium]|nr:4Fe-4S binding protein [Spirochaetales bacterium]
MKKTSKLLRIVMLIVSIGVIIGGSVLSTHVWGGKPEGLELPEEFKIGAEMTLSHIGQVNNIPNPVLKAAFGLRTKEDLSKTFSSLNLSEQEAVTLIRQHWALAQEESSKDWIKIVIKFALWFVFLFLVFLLLRAAKIQTALRRWLYALAVLGFGVVLGADPSPMGTVKDAVVLFAVSGAVFWPRLAAFGVLIVFVLLANKFICSWGCQIGTLQDFLFRLNRNRKDSARLFAPQIKPPFWLSNSVRILFFICLIAVAFLWAADLIEPIDPFRIFKPLTLGIITMAFIAVVLALSVFIYRPWCHFFCPFGLVGWIFEKISLYKIHVNYDTCTACDACAKACPSTVMSAILKRDKKTIPDCFSCGTCISVCPTSSVSFKAGPRQKPPPGKFAKD